MAGNQSSPNPRPAIQRAAAFDARVEPFDYSLEASRKQLGFFEYRKMRRRKNLLAERIDRALLDQDINPEGWWRRKGKRVANLKIDRVGVLQDLRDYVAARDGIDLTEVTSWRIRTHYPQILLGQESNCYYIPVDFSIPVRVRADFGDGIVTVGSSLALKRELQKVNADLDVEATFQMKRMVSFMSASEDDIAKFESSFNILGDFWLKFGFVVLQSLTNASVESRFPIVLL